MTKQEEKDFKSKIARTIGTRPNFITIHSAVFVSDTCRIKASYKGFRYIVQIADNKVIQVLREVG